MTTAIAHAFGKVEGINTEPKAESKRVVGKIIKLHHTGWGFISSKEIPFTRIFFHWTSLQQNTLNYANITVGMMAEFQTVPVPDKGIRAIKIKILPQEELTVEQQEQQADVSDLNINE